jgi:hypothetical protein
MAKEKSRSNTKVVSRAWSESFSFDVNRTFQASAVSKDLLCEGWRRGKLGDGTSVGGAVLERQRLQVLAQVSIFWPNLPDECRPFC